MIHPNNLISNATAVSSSSSSSSPSSPSLLVQQSAVINQLLAQSSPSFSLATMEPITSSIFDDNGVEDPYQPIDISLHSSHDDEDSSSLDNCSAEEISQLQSSLAGTFNDDVELLELDASSHRCMGLVPADTTNILPENKEESFSEEPTLTNRGYKSRDIICGRHREAFNHVGNRRFRVTISIYLSRYLQQTARFDRSVIIREIVSTTVETGVRFMKYEEGSWIKLTDKEARNKVGHALRDAAATATASAAHAVVCKKKKNSSIKKKAGGKRSSTKIVVSKKRIHTKELSMLTRRMKRMASKIDLLDVNNFELEL